MANLKKITLNINGRKDGLKRFELFEYLKNQKADIFCLQESHTLESDEHLWHLKTLCKVKTLLVIFLFM